MFLVLLTDYRRFVFSKSPVRQHRGTPISSGHLNGSVWAELIDDFVPRHMLGLAEHDHAGHFHYISSPDPTEQNNGTGTLDWKTSVGTLGEKVQYIKLSM